jgi:hypothetical protein
MATASVLKALAVTAQIYGKEFAPDAVTLLASDLSEFPEEKILASLSRCRRELRTFPTLADIILRIDDGRPGPDEAWAMIPQDEYRSTVWTDEMSEAHGIARPLLSDPIAARMAFKEAYSRIVAKNRSTGKKPNWNVSLGWDPKGREAALKEAVEKNRISLEDARTHAPMIGVDQSQNSKLKLLANLMPKMGGA